MSKGQVAGEGYNSTPVESDIEILAETREVGVVLSEPEMAAKATQEAELGNLIATLEEEKRTAMAALNDQLKDLRGARRVLDQQITDGVEMREVPVEVYYNLTENTVMARGSDDFSNIAEESREMTDGEREHILKLRQASLPGTEAEEPASPGDGAKQNAPEMPAAYTPEVPYEENPDADSGD